VSRSPPYGFTWLTSLPVNLAGAKAAVGTALPALRRPFWHVPWREVRPAVLQRAPCPLKSLLPKACVSANASSMPSAVTAEQFELVTDDPRRESVSDELRQWWKASREMRGLLTQSQAALILGVQTGQICSWVSRGRLSSRVVAGVRMVGGAEVAALLQERNQQIRCSGGRGIKAPSLSSLADAAWEDMGMDEI